MISVNTKKTPGIEVINAIKERRITCAFHDVDGTHSLIRDWRPVMSRVLYDTVTNGLPDNMLSEENIRRLVSLCGIEPLEETDRFCVESAGLSALTQMEWAIRRREQLTEHTIGRSVNSQIIDRIWSGEEKFDDADEPQEFREYIAKNAPLLFRAYEQVLNRFCRDKNVKKAKENPSEYLVPGSMEYMKYLYENGVKNYFVTGAVIDKSAAPPMGMYEEVLALGFEIGQGKLIEDIYGSTWEEKIPKEEVMEQLLTKLNIKGENVLVIGDGRSEISAGVKMGAVTVSILPDSALRERELHRQIGTNIILPDYTSKEIKKIFIGL